jgi:hypothetical protein
MISYNKIWLSNLQLLTQLKAEYQDGLIPEHEWKTMKSAYPCGFYSPNLFIRAGLFLLTLVSSSFSSVFLWLLAERVTFAGWGFLLVLGISHYIALEFVIRKDHHFRSGVDDALLLISGGLFTVAFVAATHADDHLLLLASFIFILAGIFAIRFVDSLMSLIAYLALLAMLFFGWQKIGAWGNATMPFVMMLISASVYLLLRKTTDRNLTKLYHNSILLLQIASLLTFYAAGNYFVVKELNDMLNGTVSKSIPFGAFFWAWTVCMPLVYIYFGIKQKNRILLRTGLLLIAAAVGTYKAYYRLMPVEYTLVLCGVLALLVAYVVTKILERTRNGFTTKQVRKEYLMEELQLEQMVVGESMAEQSDIVVDAGVEFGGGQFGGGGSGGGF